jgi:hypothetical protein
MTQNKMVWLGTERHQTREVADKQSKTVRRKKKLKILHPSTHIKQK